MSEQETVTEIVRSFLRAVERGDRDAILAHHDDALLMFDFPDTVRDIEEYSRTWDFFYDNQTGPLTFSPDELHASVGDTVAFVACVVHCNGTTGGDFRFRLTVGLEKRGGEWVITHEHHSLPSKDPGMAMPEKREALGLQ
jgi:ketosteroid isomerase-like protein